MQISGNRKNRTFNKIKKPIKIQGAQNFIIVMDSKLSMKVEGNRNKVQVFASQGSIDIKGDMNNIVILKESRVKVLIIGNNNNIYHRNCQVEITHKDETFHNRAQVNNNTSNEVRSMSNVENMRPPSQAFDVLDQLFIAVNRQRESEIELREVSAGSRSSRSIRSTRYPRCIYPGQARIQQQSAQRLSYTGQREDFHIQIDQPHRLQQWNARDNFFNPGRLSKQQLALLASSRPTSCLIQCSICMDKILPQDYQTFLPCLHALHSDCANLWLQKSIVCPICKTDVKEALKKLQKNDFIF